MEKEFKKNQKILVDMSNYFADEKYQKKIEVKISHKHNDYSREVVFPFEDKIYLHNGDKCGEKNNRYWVLSSYIKPINK